MTDRQTDRRTGKNNMSPDPVGGRHNNGSLLESVVQSCRLLNSSQYYMDEDLTENVYAKGVHGAIYCRVKPALYSDLVVKCMQADLHPNNFQDISLITGYWQLRYWCLKV